MMHASTTGCILTKLDYLLRECVRAALGEHDGVMSVLFYNVASQVWHHVTYEQPRSENVPDEHPTILLIKQHALGYRRCADFGRKQGMKPLLPPTYPGPYEVNQAIKDYKEQHEQAKF